MSPARTKASELALEVINAKTAWEDAKLKREQAETEYEYEMRRLVLARQRLELERSRILPVDDWEVEVTDGFGFAEELLFDLQSVELVGEPIGRAARATLLRLKHATVAKLVASMEARGFQFASDVPARELHGALVKQSWAKKNDNRGEWVYVIGGA